MKLQDIYKINNHFFQFWLPGKTLTYYVGLHSNWPWRDALLEPPSLSCQRQGRNTKLALSATGRDPLHVVTRNW
jgi:hypothetical protein